jgi:hypothetical protein
MKLHALLFTILAVLFSFRADAAETVLAENGRARFPIVIASGASEETRRNAETLATYLKKITGADFAIETGDGSRGIVLGVARDFSRLPRVSELNSDDPLRTEEYVIRSHPDGLLLVGASDLGAQNALWDFLWRQGYRQYFPGETWEVIPALPRLAVEVDAFEKPDYLMRAIWYSGGVYPERQELMRDWMKKNRMQSGIHIQAGHSYETIVSRNEAFFEANPDYLTEKKKPRLWRPEVRRFFVEQYLKAFHSRPESRSISVDPSDGGGWDTGPESKAFGSISDQVITLANEVAEALEKEAPGIRVGLYSYNEHADPPTIRVHPNVAVLVTTAFRNTRLPLREQMQAWSRQGATIGIRDYLSYAAMDYDLPSRARGQKAIGGFVKNWADYHAWGARYYSGEAQDNWGINGLLYYAASRSLWNVGEPVSLQGIREEFLEKCFGPVKDDIGPYFEELEVRPALDEDLVHRLYRFIANARAKTGDPAVLRRLNDLTLYVRYLELHNRYATAAPSLKRKAVEQMFTHLYRARLHSVDHARGIMRDMNKRASVSRNEAESKSLRAGVPPWSPDAPPYTEEEIVAMVDEGLKNNQPLDFRIPSYSGDLIPAQKLFPDAPDAPGRMGAADRQAVYYTWAEAPDTSWKIRLGNSRDQTIVLKAELWAQAEPEEAPVSVREIEIGPGETGEIQLTSGHAGLHWVFLTGPKIGDALELDPDRPWTISVAREAPVQTLASMRMNDLYFYVPKGTRLIAARGGNCRGQVVDPEGTVVLTVDNDPLIRVEVPEGMDGRLWKIAKWRGSPFQLLTAPPYLAVSPRDLLLPREVVEADSP